MNTHVGSQNSLGQEVTDVELFRVVLIVGVVDFAVVVILTVVVLVILIVVV
jgi:hypothetical protein